ncbi:cytochrome c biogenesis protein ResB [Aquabacterium sp. OR-4]|uniref:cytochrome c biogenesis protein ResB n=1 Tax=Aquabacterium sp. OR-4 TaxID=2978127 RepID=UPI0021B29167|nr:cytochrome c biogenesis protein ResB [Aquabacterium sp. OR-4]MDT7837350.1 cytochrome c biogenesis protein ResB [Aquabacterium sp. OR-4]
MSTAQPNGPFSEPARSATRPMRELLDLLASMRFAITLLSVICIASVIGTVVKQHEPYNNYVNQFGPFWAEVFDKVGLYAVYSAGWFLLILAFLVISTSLCIARNTPKILSDLKSYKEGLREQAMRSFHHKAEGRLALAPAAALTRVNELLVAHGWQARAQVRANGTMVAARKGMANKIGYLAAHSSIVLICLGGLLDGDLVVRAQMALLDKKAYAGGGLIADVKPEHRLPLANPTYRGNLLVTEGGRAGTAVISMSDGVVLQDLPFDVELKKFIVEYYETGMPKLFASEIVIHDRDSGSTTAATVKVNEPVFHRGVALYQSSFDDGGSQLTLRALPLKGRGEPFTVQGAVGGSTRLTKAPAGADGQADAEALTLEFTGLRVINVENFGDAETPQAAGSATDVRKVDLANTLDKHLGSGVKGSRDKLLRNIGPSVSYKLRDASGQAREFNNYMLPVELDGQRVFLAGVRETPAEPFRYLRIPADEQGAIDGWWRMAGALRDETLRDKAVRRYVAKATPPDKPQMAEQLFTTAQRALALFAGAEPVRASAARPQDNALGGLPALAQFVEASVPEGERARISEVLLRIVNGCLLELANLSREQAGQPPLGSDEATQRFMTQAVLSLSDAAFYPAPMLLQLGDFKQVQASVFQVARAPGKTLVYLGAVLLIVGVFAMLYIRERRLWIWLAPADAAADTPNDSPAKPHAEGPAGGTKLQAALSTTRRTLDTDAEFDMLKTALLHDAAPAAAAAPKDTP